MRRQLTPSLFYPFHSSKQEKRGLGFEEGGVKGVGEKECKDLSSARANHRVISPAEPSLPRTPSAAPPFGSCQVEARLKGSSRSSHHFLRLTSPMKKSRRTQSEDGREEREGRRSPSGCGFDSFVRDSPPCCRVLLSFLCCC